MVPWALPAGDSESLDSRSKSLLIGAGVSPSTRGAGADGPSLENLRKQSHAKIANATSGCKLRAAVANRCGVGHHIEAQRAWLLLTVFRLRRWPAAR